MKLTIELTEQETTCLQENRRRIISNYEDRTWQWMESYAENATAIYRKRLCLRTSGEFEQATKEAVLKEFNEAIGLWLIHNPRPKLGELPSILPKI